MTRIGLILSLVLSAQTAPPAPPVRPPQPFMEVQGVDLSARISAARDQSRGRDRFWIAYAFPVKPGITFDATHVGIRGAVIVIDGAGGGTPLDRGHAGLFLMFQDGGRAPVRVEIYNPGRPRDYAGLPVYWLGPAGVDESLALLRGLMNHVRTNAAAERLVDAIGAHDAPDTPSVLREIVASTTAPEPARTAAVSWLGYWPGQAEFLAGLVGDEGQPAPLRIEAAGSLGSAPDTDVLPLLQGLYRAVNHRDLRGELLDGIADERFEASALAFLIEIARNEPDRQLRREALESLGNRSDNQSLQALERIAHDGDTPPDLQDEAVETIGERPEHQSVPLLKKILSSHPRAGARGAALEALANVPGQQGLLASVAADDAQDLELRREAIEAIADTDAGSAAQVLKQLFARAGSRALKEDIVEAIADLPDFPAAVGLLTAIAQEDADRNVRAAAVSALADMQDDRATATLGRLYDSERDEPMRREILDGLADAGGTAALQKIITVARTDPSLALRRHAIELLGDSDDPAALKVLESLVK